MTAQSAKERRWLSNSSNTSDSSKAVCDRISEAEFNYDYICYQSCCCHAQTVTRASTPGSVHSDRTFDCNKHTLSISSDHSHYKLVASIMTTKWTEADVRAKIMCSNSSQHTATSTKKAITSCNTCAHYLCHSCDTAIHATAASAKHVRIAVADLKAYTHYATPGTAPVGESNEYRNLRNHGGPNTVDWRTAQPVGNNKSSTLYEAFIATTTQLPGHPSLGTRTVNIDGSLGVYAFITYATLGQRVSRFAAGLRGAGIGAKRGEHIGLYAINRAEWVIAEYACYAAGLVPVPLYDTLGAEAAAHVIAQAQLRVVVCSHEKISNLLHVANTQTTAVLQHAIVMMQQGWDVKCNTSLATTATLTITPFADVEGYGAANPLPHMPPAAADTVTLSYTSGTTGMPKGAVLTHRNIISNLSALDHSSDQSELLKLMPSDVHISYLPLAHMFERMNVANVIAKGASMGFFQGDPLKLMVDAAVLRPTTFPIVPRLANRLYDLVTNGVAAAGGVKAMLFTRGYNSKKSNYLAAAAVAGSSKPLTHTLWDRLIFNKVATAIMGGRVRVMVTGSAPINDEVKMFMRLIFSSIVFEGYGQTEANAGISTDFDGSGQVGVPLACNTIKLVDVPEMQYHSHDRPNPRGEICARGNNIFVGYYHDDAQTAAAVDREQWLHTGDIGEILPGGQLRIIDRKKNIFKLAQGEYIAPEKLENIYARAPLVAQSFVHGDSLQSSLVAVVIPDELMLMAWAAQNGVQGNFAAVCRSPVAVAAVLEEMHAAAKAAKLQSYEFVRVIYLDHTLFSLDNNILTPTMKLKRPAAKLHYQKEIDRMYSAVTHTSKL